MSFLLLTRGSTFSWSEIEQKWWMTVWDSSKDIALKFFILYRWLSISWVLTYVRHQGVFILPQKYLFMCIIQLNEFVSLSLCVMIMMLSHKHNIQFDLGTKKNISIWQKFLKQVQKKMDGIKKMNMYVKILSFSQNMSLFRTLFIRIISPQKIDFLRVRVGEEWVGGWGCEVLGKTEDKNVLQHYLSWQSNNDHRQENFVL